MYLLLHWYCTVILDFHSVSAFSWFYCHFLWDSRTVVRLSGLMALGALFCRRGNSGSAVQHLAWTRIRMKVSWLKTQHSHGPSLPEGSIYTKLERLSHLLAEASLCMQTTVVLTRLFPRDNCFLLQISAHFTCLLIMLCFLSLGSQVQLPAF